MTSKETSTQIDLKSFLEASRRVTRLQSGAIARGTYGRIRTRRPSEDEESDAGSAVASDNTVSSEGQPREALMISAEQMAKMLEDALAKQKESFKFEMEMAMQQMREMHDQQIQALANQQGEQNHRNPPNQQHIDSARLVADCIV